MNGGKPPALDAPMPVQPGSDEWFRDLAASRRARRYALNRILASEDFDEDAPTRPGIPGPPPMTTSPGHPNPWELLRDAPAWVRSLVGVVLVLAPIIAALAGAFR